MKKIVKLMLAGIALCLLISCSGKSSRETFRMNIMTDPDSFFPWESAAAETAAINYNIYEGLMGFDADGGIFPLLCENYTVSSDKLTYTFKLRNDVTFHNGEKLTAEDVVWTYENLAGLNGFTRRNDKFNIVESVSAPDKYTFTAKLKEPAAGFISLAVQPVLKKGFAYAQTSANGTGPYRLKFYELHQKVVLEKNNNYWNSEKEAKIPLVELHIINDESASMIALLSGQLDLIHKITANNAKSLSEQFNVNSEPQNMIQILGMNTKSKYLSDINVRKAISCAINKQEIIEGAHDGTAIELYSNFSPIMKTYYNDNLKDVTPYNLEKAKEYLSKSAYPNGFTLTIIAPANYPMHVSTAQIIANQLEKINIKCKVTLLEWSFWLDQVYSKADYEATVVAFGGKLDPSEIFIRYYSPYKRNFTRFNNAEFDKVFLEAETETDPQKRIDLFKECQKILAEECPAVFICDPSDNVVMDKALRGYKQYPISYYPLSELWFE